MGKVSIVISVHKRRDESLKRKEREINKLEKHGRYERVSKQEGT